ncbi:MAG: helix-turn-helix transcriptional regulator [Bacteroidota bacterium]
MPRQRPDTRVQEVVERIREKMRPWGITATFLASQLGVSRQYAWQIVHYRTFLSLEKALEIEQVVDSIITKKSHIKTFGERLRAARRSAGLTLKEVASLIGYSWVGVQRWERDQCLPKPGVLWHLLNLYGVAGQKGTELASPATGAMSGGAIGRSSNEHTVGVLGELPQMMLSNQKLAAPSKLGDHPPYVRTSGEPGKRVPVLREHQ